MNIDEFIKKYTRVRTRGEVVGDFLEYAILSFMVGGTWCAFGWDAAVAFIAVFFGLKGLWFYLKN